jgi:hypothetical protein
VESYDVNAYLINRFSLIRLICNTCNIIQPQLPNLLKFRTSIRYVYDFFFFRYKLLIFFIFCVI